MGRCKKDRKTFCDPKCKEFKPRGIPKSKLEEIILHRDECDALKLADLDDQTMQAGAEIMGISAPTFNRILQSAHKKLSDAILNSKIIKICNE